VEELGRSGVFAEPAAAAAYAGYLKALETGKIGEQDPALVLSTGSGLKDTTVVQRVVPEAPVIEPTVEALKRLLKL
jgi:threonine synthase